jgi:adenine-specific DNA-methyltransferase
MKQFRNALSGINYNKQPDSNIVNQIKQKQEFIKKNCSNNEENTKKKISEMIELSGNYSVSLNENHIDLIVRHNDKPVAIFEVKAPANKNEMIQPGNLNKKAFHEIMLYLLEMRKQGQVPLYAVITNGISWYVFPAELLLLYIDTDIKNFDIRTALELPTDTVRLPFNRQTTLHKKDKYKVLEQYLDNEKEFFAQCAKDILSFNSPKDIAVFLSEDILAGQYNPNIGNVLNDNFYKELLYIFGLEEKKKNGKKGEYK